MTIGCSKNCVVCGDCPNNITLNYESCNDITCLEFYENDFDSKEDYNVIITLAESFGCECK